MFALFQWVMDTASLFLFSSSSSSSCFFLVQCVFLCVLFVLVRTCFLRPLLLTYIFSKFPYL